MGLSALGTGVLNFYDGTEWVAVGGAVTTDNFTPLHDMTPLGRHAVTATASGTAHTKGAWIEIVASTTADINFMALVPYNISANATVTSVLYDVGVGAAGSETVVVANIGAGGATWGAALPDQTIALPITIPSGSRIALRIQAVQTTPKTAAFYLYTYTSGPATPTSVTTFGGNTATSRGVDITSANTWTEVVASLADTYDYMMLVPSQATGTGMTTSTLTMDVGIGSAGSEQVYRSFRVGSTTGEAVGFTELSYFYALFAGPPAGSRLSVRVNAANFFSITGFGAKLP